MYAGNYGRKEGGRLRVVAHYEHNRPVEIDCRLEEENVEICEGWIGRSRMMMAIRGG